MVLKKDLLAIILIYIALALLTIWQFDGTADHGDSVYHYLFAKYALQHPELFFDHWAKPLFVLFASPFAAFGFEGIKMFNVIATIFSMIFSYKIAEKLELRLPILAPVFIIFSPQNYVLTFSGLTEPFFAAILMFGIYILLSNKYLAASIIISFLPFVRSEGLLIIGVFGLYFIIKKDFKALALLSTGHLAYSIAGYFIYKDILWVFTKIPYANLGSPYGSGGIFDFVFKVYNMVGLPIFILFSLGFIIMISRIHKSLDLKLHLIIVGSFVAFIGSHAIFWFFGIFNSMGLERVIVAVVPIIGLIALRGINFFLVTINNRRISYSIVLIFCILTLVFPFTKSPAAIDFKNNLSLNADQESIIKASEFVKTELSGHEKLACEQPYMFEILGIDCFGEDVYRNINSYSVTLLKPGDLLILTRLNGEKQQLIENKDLDKLGIFHLVFDVEMEKQGRRVQVQVFEKGN